MSRSFLTDCLRVQGFLILRQCIPRELTEAARKRWNTSPAEQRGGANGMGANLGTSPDFVDLVMGSCVKTLLENEMGPFTDPVGCMLAVTAPLPHDPPRIRANNEINSGTQAWGDIGSPGLHIDGTWAGAYGLTQDEVDAATGKPYDVEKWLGDESDQSIGVSQDVLPDRSTLKRTFSQEHILSLLRSEIYLNLVVILELLSEESLRIDRSPT